MNQVVKSIYLGIFAMFIIAVIVLNVNFYKAETLLEAEIDTAISKTTGQMNVQIDAWIDERVLFLDNIGDAIQMQGIDDPIFLDQYLKRMTDKYPEVTSLYMGFPDNSLIISNDWQPEAGFLLYERPWYQGAIASDGVIMTEPFEDAYTKVTIVSFAKALYDSQDHLLGVVSYDIPITALEEDLIRFTDDFKGRTIVFNSSGEIVLSFGTALFALEDSKLFDYKRADILGSDYEILERTQIMGIEGYFLRHVINRGLWEVVSFSPMSEHNKGLKELRYAVWTLTGLLILIFYFFYAFQKKHVTRPLILLENQISKLDMNNLPNNYQLEITSDSMFEKVETQINSLLKALFIKIDQVELEKLETSQLNERLQKSYAQMIQTEDALKIKKNHFEALFTNSSSAVAMFDENHIIRDANQSFVKLFGYEMEELLGKDLDDIVAPGRMKEVRPKTDQVFSGENLQFEAIRYHKDKSEIPVKIIGVPIVIKGITTGGFGIYQDISTRVTREKYLEYVSTHDFLTNVYNRRYFETYMYDSDTPSMLPLSLIMVDINGLKIINDAYGNEEGDRVLVITAELLKEIAETIKAPVFRIGGDEFVIVMRNADGHKAETLANDIKEAHQRRNLDQLQLSLAIGWAERTSMKTKIANLLKEAEDFMYSQKLNENPSIRNKTVMTVMNTLHEKSRREEQHSKRVSELSYGLGKALGLRDRECEMLRMMGLLHDVGKIAIDDKILNKPAKLTDEEYEIMKRHPEIGFRILSSVNELSEIANHVLAHHERWDGAGYPKGLKAQDIPYLARVISIVDAYDAMTSCRSYREGLSTDLALEEIMGHSGKQFDPEIAEIFVKHIREIEN